MKYFFPVLMALVILTGLGLALTPYVADYFFPSQTNGLRVVKPDDVRAALADWFGTPLEAFADVQGVQQMSAGGSVAWFAFAVDRQAVEQFIRSNRLEQRELSEETMRQVFMADNPPAAWWQPRALTRQTCFIGTGEGQTVGLVYNADLRRGFLIVKRRQKTHSF